MNAFWLFCADAIRKWHVWLLVLAAAATIGLAFGIPRLEFKTSQDTIVPSGSEIYAQNVRYERQFGGEPVLVLFSGEDIRQLFTGENKEQLAALEAELVASGLYHSVFGPLGLLEFARDQVPVGAELAVARQDRAAEAARLEAAAQGAGEEEQGSAWRAGRGAGVHHEDAEQAERS